VNDVRKRAMARKVSEALGGSLRGRRLAVLGLTFKPKTDDMREAPSLSLIQALQDLGGEVRAYDPAGLEQARKVLTKVEFCEDEYACAAGADAVIIVTEWEQFRALDLPRLKGIVREPVIVDLRNIYRPEEVCQHGFRYVGVGRGEAAEL
jgi:UDPglucose 6-dehydrogenase